MQKTLLRKLFRLIAKGKDQRGSRTGRHFLMRPSIAIAFEELAEIKGLKPNDYLERLVHQAARLQPGLKGQLLAYTKKYGVEFDECFQGFVWGDDE